MRNTIALVQRGSGVGEHEPPSDQSCTFSRKIHNAEVLCSPLSRPTLSPLTSTFTFGYPSSRSFPASLLSLSGLEHPHADAELCGGLMIQMAGASAAIVFNNQPYAA
eukprot:1901751-Rhodomonas_salina.1